MYHYLAKHLDLLPAVIGITHRQFRELLPKFSYHLRKAEHIKAYSKPRKREPGGGNKPKLKTDKHKLFFILFYYKVYPTFRLAQVLFQLDKRNVQLWVRFLEPVLSQALGYQLELPIVKARHLGVIIEICPSLKEFIVDCTERYINRPKDNVKQRKYYSGKKKRHTIKDQILVNPRNRKILAVTPKSVEGKQHDKKIMENDFIFTYCPPKSKGMGDSAYQGTDEINPRLQMIIPQKKPKGEELTPEQKKSNKAISQIRVRVEHPFSYLKHFNILAHPFRNNLQYAHTPFQTIAALYNFSRNFPP